MLKVRDVCRHIRSKNAGPFWVTVDVFFNGPQDFDKYVSSPALGPESFASLYGANPELVKRVAVKSLSMVKISYPRPQPQGWMGERDMHQGQSFARLLQVEIE